MVEYGIVVGVIVMIGDMLYDLLMVSNVGVDSLVVMYGVYFYVYLLEYKLLVCLDIVLEFDWWLKNFV